MGVRDYFPEFWEEPVVAPFRAMEQPHAMDGVTLAGEVRKAARLWGAPRAVLEEAARRIERSE